MRYKEMLPRSTPEVAPGTERRILSQLLGLLCFEQMLPISTILAEHKENTKHRRSKREGRSGCLTKEWTIMLLLICFFHLIGVLGLQIKEANQFIITCLYHNTLSLVYAWWYVFLFNRELEALISFYAFLRFSCINLGVDLYISIGLILKFLSISKITEDLEGLYLGHLDFFFL